jgi:hypothetical protein
MSSPVSLYQSEMHENIGYFATWLPGDPVEVGDVGIFEGGRFRVVSSLKDLEVPFSTEPAGALRNVQYTSTEGTSIRFNAGAGVKELLDAEVAINFSGAGSFLFHASGLQAHRLSNRTKVAKALLVAYQRKRWEKPWLLVESVHVAGRATIVVSSDSSAELVLSATAEGALAELSLADPKVELGIVSVKGRLFQTIAAANLHPLYSCFRVEDPFFGKPSVQPVRGASDASGVEFMRPGIAELLQS